VSCSRTCSAVGSGKVVVFTGACSQGQGHETVFAQVCAEALGVRYEDVTVVGGDTAGVPYGWGTLASRSTVVAGTAIAQEITERRDASDRDAARPRNNRYALSM
jgi:aerobic carbon-monoxide dehydrogenase large subunit